MGIVSFVKSVDGQWNVARVKGDVEGDVGGDVVGDVGGSVGGSVGGDVIGCVGGKVYGGEGEWQVSLTRVPSAEAERQMIRLRSEMMRLRNRIK